MWQRRLWVTESRECMVARFASDRRLAWPFIHSRASLVWQRTSLKNTQKLCYQEIFHSQYESLMTQVIQHSSTKRKQYSASCYGNHIRITSVAVRQITMIVATQVYMVSLFQYVCLHQSKWNVTECCELTSLKYRDSLTVGCQSLEWTPGVDYWTDLFCTKNHFYGL